MIDVVPPSTALAVVTKTSEKHNLHPYEKSTKDNQY